MKDKIKTFSLALLLCSFQMIYGAHNSYVDEYGITHLSIPSKTNKKVNECIFPLTNEPLDVIIPCVEKDLPILERCIKGIKQYGQDIRRVIVISKNLLTNNAEWFCEDNFPFSMDDVEDELSLNDPERKKALHVFHHRTGWYFQQLLKLYAHRTIPYLSSNVLILDSDTIFLRPTRFLNDQNGAQFNTSRENYAPYFKHAHKLLPNFNKCYDCSGISHHMVMQRPIVESLLREVEDVHKKPFWKAFCHLVETSELNLSGASEYEIYFNYALSHTPQVSIRNLHYASCSSLSEVSKKQRQGYDYVSLHSYCRED